MEKQLNITYDNTSGTGHKGGCSDQNLQVISTEK